MMSEDNLARWLEFKPYNQVMYGDEIALIIGGKQAGKYLISVINERGLSKCYNAKESDLRPIKLDEGGNIIRRCVPNKITPDDCTFCTSDCNNKVTITFFNNYCKVTKDGNEIFEGPVLELHVLQNMLREIFGWVICCINKQSNQ